MNRKWLNYVLLIIFSLSIISVTSQSLKVYPKTSFISPGVWLNYTIYVYKNDNFTPIGYYYFEIQKYKDNQLKLYEKTKFFNINYENHTTFIIKKDGFINQKMGYSVIFIPPGYKGKKIRIEGYDLFYKKTIYGILAYGSEKVNDTTIRYYFYYDSKGFLKRIKINRYKENIYIILSSWNSSVIKPYALRWKNKEIKLSYEVFCCNRVRPEKIGIIEYSIKRVQGYLMFLNESIKIEEKINSKLLFIDADTGEDITNDKYGSVGLWVSRVQEKLLVMGVLLKRIPVNETMHQYEGTTLDSQSNIVKMIYFYNATGFLKKIEISTISKNGTLLVSETIRYTSRFEQKEEIIYRQGFIYASLILVLVALSLYIYEFVIRKKGEDIEKLIVILMVLSSVIALFIRDENVWMVIAFSAIVMVIIRLLMGERLHV